MDEEEQAVYTYVVMRRRVEEAGLLVPGDETDLSWLSASAIAFGIRRNYWQPLNGVPAEVEAELKG